MAETTASVTSEIQEPNEASIMETDIGSDVDGNKIQEAGEANLTCKTEIESVDKIEETSDVKVTQNVEVVKKEEEVVIVATDNCKEEVVNATTDDCKEEVVSAATDDCKEEVVSAATDDCKEEVVSAATDDCKEEVVSAATDDCKEEVVNAIADKYQGDDDEQPSDVDLQSTAEGMTSDIKNESEIEEGSDVDPVTNQQTIDNEDDPQINDEIKPVDNKEETGATLDKSEEVEGEQSENENNDDEVSDNEDGAPVRRRRGVSSDGEEVLEEEDEVQSEGKITEEEEKDVIVEDEELEEGEIIDDDNEEEGWKEGEEETNEEKEDTENPQFVPKQGLFFMHDDRTDSTEDTKAPAKKKLWDDKGKWGHDRFNLDEQGPKPYRDVMHVYGYDIRERNSPPTFNDYNSGRGNRGRGRGGQRSKPLVSDYIENKRNNDYQAEEKRESPPQRRGFGRGLQRGRRKTYPKQSEERMVDEVYDKNVETQNYQSGHTRNNYRNTYNDCKQYTNQDRYDERNRSQEDGAQQNRERNRNWDKRDGEDYKGRNRQEYRNDKRDTRYRQDRDSFENKQRDRYDNRNVQNRLGGDNSFDKRQEESTGNRDMRYSNRGRYNESRGRGRGKGPVVNRPYENRQYQETDTSKVSVVEEEWPSLSTDASKNTDSDVPMQWGAKDTRKENTELSSSPAKTESIQTQPTPTTSSTSVEDNLATETATSREAKSFSQRRHQRSTIKEIPKISVVVPVPKDSANDAGTAVNSQAPKLLQNFQIRLEGGQRKIVKEETKEQHVKTEDKGMHAPAAERRGGNRPHRFSSQRPPADARAGRQSESPPQHYYEPGYQGQVYRSDGTPPPNVPDSSHTPPHGVMRQSQNISGSPSPRLPNQITQPPPSISDTSQAQLSDAAAMLPNSLPVQGLQPGHPRNTGMLHPAVSMGAHPPQGAFPPTTFVNVHYNPGHPVPQPVHTRPAQGLPVQPSPVQGHPLPQHGHPPRPGLAGPAHPRPAQGLTGPSHPRPAQGLTGPGHGHPRPAQGIAGPMSAPYQIAPPVPVQHFPVTSVPQAAVAATQNMPSMGPQIQQEVMIDNHGLTYKGATYYSPEIQFGMQRVPPRRQPQPVRIEAPPNNIILDHYHENLQ
ncbi:uncharacterized protein [Antedon mediterranea]|uniref:uncharacterized protein n=1 Tax=Antedon mediterranea TaxID=105859 RepID=UPI003AF75DDB